MGRLSSLNDLVLVVSTRHLVIAHPMRSNTDLIDWNADANLDVCLSWHLQSMLVFAFNLSLLLIIHRHTFNA